MSSSWGVVWAEASFWEGGEEARVLVSRDDGFESSIEAEKEEQNF